MSSPIDKMLQQFGTIEELQAFCRAQQKTLIDMTKKLKASDDEIKHLKKLLEGAVPVINAPAKIDLSSNDEEAIAREQLYLLKKLSSERELTLEETKRYEIFSKMLTTLKDKPKTIEATARNLSNDQLMAAMKTDDDDRSSDQH
jgi:acetolactate synthase small subunit